MSDNTTALATQPRQPIVKGGLTDVVEQVLIQGDLSPLSSEERVQYYNRVCESLGLNPLTRPFEYTKLNGKLILYAKRDCAEQLRRIYGISVTITNRQTVSGIHMVTARATTADGRCDEAMGAVNIGNKSGEDLANALMKAETKAKRRVTLSICGLGFFDETEVSDTPRQDVQQAADLNAELEAVDAPTQLPQPANEPETRQPEPDTEGVEAEPPEIPTNITREFVMAECERCGADPKAVGAWVKLNAPKSKFDNLDADQRLALVDGIRGGEFAKKGGE
mgnify:CR=1 FL=1